MANSKSHILTGAVIGLGAYTVWKYVHKEEIKLSGILSSLLVGGFCGLLPDLIEPALHPNHRSVFHSVAALTGLSYAGYKVIRAPWRPESKSHVIVMLVSYASHLLLDSRTPKGLPVLDNGKFLG